MTARRCRLCGHDGPDVRVGIVELATRKERPYDSIARCTDAAACRARAEAAGKTWAAR